MNPRNTQAVAVRPPSTADVTAMPRELRHLRSEAALIANSELVPESIRGKPDSVMLIALRGKSLGIDLTTALAEIHVIEGRTMCSAQIAGAVARRAAEWWTEESSSERCTIAGHRHGHPDRVSRVTFTIDDAKRAGVLDVEWRETKWDKEKGKATVTARWVEGDGPKPAWVDPANRNVRKSWRENWHRWPQNMLFARAITNWVRQNCGETLLGIDIDENIGPVADVVDTAPGRPARVDTGHQGGDPDDDILEAELVDVTVVDGHCPDCGEFDSDCTCTTNYPPAPARATTAHWADTWQARCNQAGCTKQIANRLIYLATEGLTVLPIDVPEGMRAACDLLLERWAEERPGDITAWFNEPEAP